MAAEYLTWEDFLDEEEGKAPPPPAGDSLPAAAPSTETAGAPFPAHAGAPAISSTAAFIAALPEGVELPEEVQSLLNARAALEHRMKVLTGQVPPPDEDAYIKAKFPIKVHTKESRIEERRLNLLDQQRQMLTKQAQEQTILGRAREVERAREIEVRRQQALQRELQTRRAQARTDELRKTLERRLAEAERVKQQWAGQRAQALMRARHEIRQELVLEQARAEEQRRLVVSQLILLQRKQEEELAIAEQQR